MGTRAMWTFKENAKDKTGFNVYKHWDGYPDAALGFLTKALTKSWELPRYEPDEFAASFITANKEGSGDVRLLPSGYWFDVAPGDIEYRYEVYMSGITLTLKGYSVDNDKSTLVLSKSIKKS
jgi:hypothetical protein